MWSRNQSRESRWSFGFDRSFWRWVFLFVGFPIVELLGLWILSASFLGTLFTLILIFVSGLVGAWLFRYQTRSCWDELNRTLDRGSTPTLPLVHSLLLILAGVFLIVPGVLTELMGFLLLIPLVRSLVASHIVLRFEIARNETQWQRSPRQSQESDAPDIIDV